MREAKIQVKGGTIIEELYVSIVNAVERHLGDCPDVLCDDLWGIIQHDCQDDPSGSLIPITETETEDTIEP